MFPDFSGLGDGIQSLNDKFDRIIELLAKQNELLEKLAGDHSLPRLKIPAGGF